MSDAVVRDPGLQPERTAMSWSRTALSLAVNAVVLARGGVLADAPVLLVVSALLGIAALGAIFYGMLRRRELERTVPAPPVHPLAFLLATIITVLACIAGIVSILLLG